MSHSRSNTHSDSSTTSTILPFGTQEFSLDRSAPLPLQDPDTSFLTSIPQGEAAPCVVPTDLGWRDHPRWRSLVGSVTPTRVPIPADTLVPDPSPPKTPISCDVEGEASLGTSTGSFIHRRRRGEYIQRPPVWAIHPLVSDSDQTVFDLSLGGLSFHNQFRNMASVSMNDPIVVGMANVSTTDENAGRSGGGDFIEAIQPTTEDNSITPSRFEGYLPGSDDEFHCTPSNIECSRCNDRVLCEYCNGCERCDDLNNIGQQCPALSDSADERIPLNLTRADDNHLVDPNSNPSLASLSNQSIRGRPQPNLSTVNDPDAITPAPQKSPDGVPRLSQGNLTAAEKRVIGDYVSKLPSGKKEQAMQIIRDKLPNAKEMYDTVVDVLQLPEDVLKALRTFIQESSGLNTSSENASPTRKDKAISPKSPRTGSSKTDPCEHGNQDEHEPMQPLQHQEPEKPSPYYLKRYKDSRVKASSYAIEVGSTVITVGYTDLGRVAIPGEFMLKPGQVFTVLQMYGDQWASCIRSTMDGAFQGDDTEYCEMVHGSRVCVVAKDNPNIGFLPLCAVTLLPNYADFLSFSKSDEQTESWNGKTLKAPVRVQSLEVFKKWMPLKEITIPHEYCQTHKALTTMQDPSEDVEPLIGTDEKRLMPYGYYRRAPNSEQDKAKENVPRTLRKKTTQQFQSLKSDFKEALGLKGDDRDEIESKLKRYTLKDCEARPRANSTESGFNKYKPIAMEGHHVFRKRVKQQGTEAHPGLANETDQPSAEPTQMKAKRSMLSLPKLKRENLPADRSEEPKDLSANDALPKMPSPRDSQLGPVSEADEVPADNLNPRDPGGLLADPAAAVRHLDPAAWPVGANPRRMSQDPPRGEVERPGVLSRGRRGTGSPFFGGQPLKKVRETFKPVEKSRDEGSRSSERGVPGSIGRGFKRVFGRRQETSEEDAARASPLVGPSTVPSESPQQALPQQQANAANAVSAPSSPDAHSFSSKHPSLRGGRRVEVDVSDELLETLRELEAKVLRERRARRAAGGGGEGSGRECRCCMGPRCENF